MRGSRPALVLMTGICLAAAWAGSSGGLAATRASAAATANTMVGGRELDGNEVCTSGFNVKTAAGESRTLTAGHCGRSTFFRGDGAYFGVTDRLVESASGGDFQTADPTGGWSLPAKVHYEGVNVAVHGRTTATNGMTACWRGAASAVSRCGAVYDADESSVVEGTTYSHTFKVHGCGIKGDSGAPVFTFVNQAGTNRLYALGIVQGGNPVNDGHSCASSPHIVVQPIGKVLSNWNLTLKTD